MSKKPLIKKSKLAFISLVCLGAALMIAGAVANYFLEDDTLGGRMLGAGAGFGSAIIAVAAVNLLLIKRNPDKKKQQEINEKDERFIKIREKSAQSTWYVTLFSLLALEFAFLFFDYLIPCYVVIGAMAIHVGSYFIFIYRNSKRF